MKISKTILSFAIGYAAAASLLSFPAMAQDDYDSDGNAPQEYDEPPVEPAPEPEEKEPPPEPEEREPPPEPEEREPPPEPEEREPPVNNDDDGGPRPDPNYGNSTATIAAPVDEEKEKKRRVIKTVERKEFTRGQVAAECRKYNEQLVAFYGAVFKVVNCQRRRITDHKNIYAFVKKGAEIQDVSQDTIAMIPEGTPLDRAINEEQARPCSELEGRYVSFSNVDTYYVEKCKRRKIPDWETYVDHRKKNGKGQPEILALSYLEFSRLATGTPVPSVIDEPFARLLDGSAGVDVIPQDEACAGLNNKIASYYDKLYRIENCRKRNITDPGSFFKARDGVAKFVELTSEQWLSLPDGEPLK